MKTCTTCQKKNTAGTQCKVLTEMIGKTQQCWAWTDDSEWENKCKIATKNYIVGKCWN